MCDRYCDKGKDIAIQVGYKDDLQKGERTITVVEKLREGERDLVREEEDIGVGKGNGNESRGNVGAGGSLKLKEARKEEEIRSLLAGFSDRTECDGPGEYEKVCDRREGTNGKRVDEGMPVRKLREIFIARDERP